MARRGRARVLFAAAYPTSQAGTRLRAEAWFDELRRQGIEPELWSFIREQDNDRWFGGASVPVRLALTLLGLLRTAGLWLRVPRYDAVVVLREVAPVASAFVERRAASRSRLVWDVDDAVWAPYPRLFLAWLPDRLRRSEAKYREVAQRATQVWAGSEALAEWCRAAGGAVWVVPTVQPLPSALPPPEQRSGMVWVGSLSTAVFLEQVLPHLGAERRLTVVGASVAPVPGLDVVSVPWSLEAEDAALRGARVGLYPLDAEHPLTGARAGFKAVLYMSYGLPSVVTPAGAVATLVRDGQEALHATEPADWAPACARLLDDDALWTRLSANARRRAEQEYSTGAWAPRVARRLLDVLAGPAGR